MFEDLWTEYLFQSSFQMLLEYMERQSGLETEEFEEIIEQKLNKNMATRHKTMFEVRDERAELRGEQRGENKKARLTILRELWRGFSKNDLADLSELSEEEVEKLSISFNEVQEMWQTKDFENKEIPNLSVEEVNYLLELFDKKH